MINLGFVGLGWWGNELAVAASELSSRIAITGCCSLSQNEMTVFETQFGAKPYPSYVDLLKDPSTEGVILSTPHSQHANQVIQAAEAGKQVFVEKPLALSIQDASSAVRICTDQEVVLAVGHNRRFSSVAGKLKSWLKDERLGHVLHVEAHFSGNSALGFTVENWRANRRESPAGSLVSIGLHMIDTVQWLLGPVDRLSCLSKRQVLPVEIEDTTVALFELKGGITGTLGTLFAVPQHSYLRLYGTKGIAEARDDFTELTWHPDGQASKDIRLEPVNTLVAELTAFCDACDGIKTYPVTLLEALGNVAVVEAMANSSQMNGQWINVLRSSP